MSGIRKQEAIHLHQLVAEIHTYLEDDGAAVQTPRYDEQDTRPLDVSASKQDHYDALHALADDLAEYTDQYEAAAAKT